MKKNAFKQLCWEDLDPQPIVNLIELAKSEDLEGTGLIEEFPYSFDVTSEAMLDAKAEGKANIVARKDMTVAGLPLVPLVLRSYGDHCTFEPFVDDGDQVKKGCVLGHIEGKSKEILQAERILLNFLQKLSGIATLTSQYVVALEGSETRILDTRKTTPGYRILEKYAVACGGGWNHRRGLYEWILVKDNHLCSAKATEGKALEQKVAHAKSRFADILVEVEVDHMEQINPVLEAGADIIMLDNFSNAKLKQAVALIDGRAITEASGGIEIDRLAAVGKTGVDFVSSGALIHQSRWVDIGLDWDDS